MTTKEIIAKMQDGRIAPIIKEVAGRRMLFGFEPANRRSRKYHVKQMLRQPLDLHRLVHDHGNEKRVAAGLPPLPYLAPGSKPLTRKEKVARAILNTRDRVTDFVRNLKSKVTQ